MANKQKQANHQVANDKSDPWVCVCNKVKRSVIAGVIQRGCRTLPRISTATTAGAGQCGGTCRPDLEKMIAEFETQNPNLKTKFDKK